MDESSLKDEKTQRSADDDKGKSQTVSGFFDALRLMNEKRTLLSEPGHKGDPVLESQLKELEAYVRAYLKAILPVRPKVSILGEEKNERGESRLRMRVEFEDLVHFYEAVTKSLGKGGLFIKTDQVLPINTLLVLEVLIRKEGIELTLSAKVIWVNPKDSPERPMGIGVKLYRLSSLQRQVLEDFKKGELGAEAIHHLSE